VSAQNVQCSERPAIIGSVMPRAIESAIGPSDNGEGRTTRHDCDTRDVTGHRIHPLPGRALRHAMAREGFSQSRPFLGCFIGTFSPLTFPQTLNTFVPLGRLLRNRLPGSGSPASLRLATRQPPGGSHIGGTAASARSCLRPGGLRQHAPVALDVAWSKLKVRACLHARKG